MKKISKIEDILEFSNIKKHLGKEFLDKQLEGIKTEKLINEEVVSEKDFEYEKYFGPEIIP